MTEADVQSRVENQRHSSLPAVRTGTWNRISLMALEGTNPADNLA